MSEVLMEIENFETAMVSKHITGHPEILDPGVLKLFAGAILPGPL